MLNPITPGEWRIHSVIINSQLVDDSEGFALLVSRGDELRLEPAGISFQINQSTPRSAILESRSQIFYADFFIRGEHLTLNLSRPAFQESVSLKAVLEKAKMAKRA